MDFVAARASRFQFVKVVSGGADFEPVAGEKNQYIQNAMSNFAEPIFVTLTGDKMSMRNINEDKRVNIAAGQPRAKVATN